jgi:hypothetical protein
VFLSHSGSLWPPAEAPCSPVCLSRPTGPLPHSAVAQNNKLFIHTVDESVNTTFICSVTNALGTRQEEMAIQVKSTEENGEIRRGAGGRHRVPLWCLMQGSPKSTCDRTNRVHFEPFSAIGQTPGHRPALHPPRLGQV